MNERSLSNDQPGHEQLFARVWAFFGLLLLAVTWRLWTPQTVYPQIPFFEVLVQAPLWLDWLGFAITVCALTMAMFARRASVRSSSLMLFAISIAFLIMLDQHRLQPWAWQYFLFAVLMGISRDGRSFRWMRIIVISIYIYSAISKFDYQFLHTVGQQFLSTLAGLAGVSLDNLSPETRVWMAVAFPVTELLVGIGLLIRRTRRPVAVVAVLLHLSLLLVLGPLGLGHQPAVLVWNLWFAIQAIFLFWLRDGETADQVQRPVTPAGRSRGRSSREVIAATVVSLAILFPATESIDLCDHWPAWDLYSPRSSRARVYILRSAADRLPLEIQENLVAMDNYEIWVRVRIDHWSLESLSVPVYPEDRFQFAVARALMREFWLERDIRVKIQSDSDRFTGLRTEEVLAGSQAIERAAGDFRFNTRVRVGSGRDMPVQDK